MLNIESLKRLFRDDDAMSSGMVLTLAGSYVPYLIGIIEGQREEIETLKNLLALEKSKNGTLTKGFFAVHDYEPED